MAASRLLAKACELTPTRFDVLYIVREARGQLCQSGLRRALGVARFTMSRMVRTLVKLGLLERWPAPDGRTWRLELTREGVRRVAMAIRIVFRRRLLQAHYEKAFAAPNGADDVHRLVATTRHVARHVGDRATFIYPSDHPDED